MEWTLANGLLATAFVTLGAVLQAVTGLGAGLIIVPLLALISIDLIPGPLIFGSLALSTAMAVSGRRQIDFANTRTILFGVLLGTVAAAAYISRLPLDALGIVFGVIILAAIVISLRAPRFSLTSRGNVLAGALSGFLGTSAGVGAPVLALLFQHHPGKTLRATLAFLYAASSITMVIFLHVAGRFGVQELLSGLFLIPGFLLGYVLSPKLASLVDRGYARSAVLIVSTISACVLIWRSASLFLVD